MAAFPEVPGELEELRARGWRLAILSNSDPDLLAASLENDRRAGRPDASRPTIAGSYKPAHGHWERLFERDDVDRCAPRARRGERLPRPRRRRPSSARPSVWINRLGEESDAPRAAELTDLYGLADTLDSIVAS